MLSPMQAVSFIEKNMCQSHLYNFDRSWVQSSVKIFQVCGNSNSGFEGIMKT